MVIVKACGRMVPRLEAEEALQAVDQLVVGVRAQAADRRAKIAEWERAAHRGQKPPKAARATPEGLAGIGIHYIVEPPREVAS